MDRIQEFIEILSDTEVQERAVLAKFNRVCKMCGQPADEFFSAASEFEYRVSAICQSCQDHYIY